MKKTLFILLFLSFNLTLFAQLNILKRIPNERTIGHIKAFNTVLLRKGDMYYLRMKYKKSNDIFYIGNNKSETLETLYELYYLCKKEEIGTVLLIKDAHGNKAQIDILSDIDSIFEENPRKTSTKEYSITIKPQKGKNKIGFVLSEKDILMMIDKVRGEP